MSPTSTDAGWRTARTRDSPAVEIDAGPSDYWRRSSPSPPSIQDTPLRTWRTRSDHPVSTDDLGLGPSDAYAGSNGLYDSHRNRPPSSREDQIDEESYERRKTEILDSLPLESLVHDGESPPSDSIREGYTQTYQEIMQDDGSASITSADVEEEFGALRSSYALAPSTASLRSRPPKDQTSPAVKPNFEKRASVIHPSISRLRSHMRTASTSTQQTTGEPRLSHLRSSSHFSQISDAKSSSGSGRASPLGVKTAQPEPSPAFTFHPLRRASAHLFSRDSTISRAEDATVAAELGRPTAMDVRGMIAVGTDRGHVNVYGFNQDLKHVIGNEGSGSAVTKVTISPDQTYIAVGRASGNIHLYDLANPSKPARTTLALTLKQVLSGRREGHLQGSRILHIGFVGARHTSIVTGDEHGRSFWWSLGKVIGVESNDVVRMLGNYPETSHPRRPTTLFAVEPMPLGDAPSIDAFNLSALLTPTKLVVVGMKPTPKTWFRKIRNATGGEHGGLTGCALWFRPPGTRATLVYSWGTRLRFLSLSIEGASKEPLFVEGLEWTASAPIRAIQAYDDNHLIIVTSTGLVLLETETANALETTPFQTRLLSSLDSGLASAPRSLTGSVRVHRQKLFLLVGSLLHWNDRILSRVHSGDFLSAIRIALAYYENRADGNLMNLPHNLEERKTVVQTQLEELMTASLHWAFSPDRLTDDTHFSPDGRGVDLTSLFEGLAAACIEVCMSTGNHAFLFDEAYEHFTQVGIERIFLEPLESHIFSGRLRNIPPSITQALILMHAEKNELDLAESVIWNVDPISLDINQAVNLCETHGLWDAMIHVYTRAMQDYVAPLVKLITVVRDIQTHRLNRPSLVGERDAGDLEEMAPNAYKLYAYIEATLSGLSYPSGELLPELEGHAARTEVYTFIFQGRTISWPAQGSVVLTSDGPEPPYPYLRLLLRFDTEAFLHSMDIAFEDPYLNDTSGAINRQSIVNLMLDVMDPEYFHPGDITFLHIFVARNLPKYPQFLFIPPSTLHRILISLASDPDQSTREDRQLAAEYLLSAYTPHDLDTMLRLFDQAGFFRILRAAYRRDSRWAQLISTLLRDPESDDQVFTSLHEIINAATPSGEIKDAVIEALPHLFALDVRQTARLIDHDLPSCHDDAIDLLASAPHKQMAYLRCLLEPDNEHAGSHLNTNARHRYVRLLCQNEPDYVIAFLDSKGTASFDLDRLARESDDSGFPEPQIWALDNLGRSKEAMDVAGTVLRARGIDLGEALIANDLGGTHLSLQSIQAMSRMAVRLCQEHSKPHEPAVEDMWLDVLHAIIQLVHSASALRGQAGRTASVTSVEDVVVAALRSLVQETLASLLSSSSSSLSFPRLFKRLVDASTPTKGRAYSEFRTILTGMLDSYRAEGEMLGMTTRLVEADLFEVMENFSQQSSKGWSPRAYHCSVCQGSLCDPQASWIVSGSGNASHQHCLLTSA